MKQRSLLALLACLVTSLAHAGIEYRVTQITGPSTSFVNANGLNDRGAIVGSADVAGTGEYHAFVWKAGEYSDLHYSIPGTLQNSTVSAINDKFAMVGYYPDAQFVNRSFLLRGSQATPITAFSDDTSVFVHDINNREQVLGVSRGIDGKLRPFVWNEGHAIELKGLNDGSGELGVGGLNNRGAAVGTDSSNGGQAVLWQDHTVMALGGLPNAVTSLGIDINDKGQALGLSEMPSETWFLIYRAFIWADGEIVALPPLGSRDSSHGRSINNRGIVVGTSYRNSGEDWAAVIWRNGLPYSLSDLIAADDPLKPYVTLWDARSINNRGEIVAIGVDSRTPGAGPSTYLLKPAR